MDHHKHPIPDAAKKLYQKEVKVGIPTAIGYDDKLGYYIIQTAGQGPYLIWQERHS